MQKPYHSAGLDSCWEFFDAPAMQTGEIYTSFPSYATHTA